MARNPESGKPDAEEAQLRTRRRAAFLTTLRHASASALGSRPADAPAAGDGASADAGGDERAAPGRALQRTRAAPPAPAPPSAPAAVEPARPRSGLFRTQALQHRLSVEEGRGVVHVTPPWTWALACGLGIAVALALVVSFVGRVEVTTRGRGILRPVAGVQALTARLAGTVAAVEVRSGDRVGSGAVLVRIDSPSAQAELLEADRQLEAVRTQFASATSQQDQHYGEQVQALRARAQRVSDQIASLRESERYYQRRLEADTQLLRKGLVSEMAAGEWREQLAQAQRQLSGAQLALDQTRQELASLEGRRQDEVWQRQQVLSAAQNKRDALAVVMKQAVVQAPQDGTVELLVKPGEVVQVGQPVGRLVPVDSPLEVVALLAERDRAFVKPGDEVRLELDQLPYAEYGALKGKVVRISDDLISSAEVRDAFGEAQKLEAPSYRAELAITDASAAEAARVKLRTGGLMNVRYTLRRQRLITLVVKPLRRWLH